VSRTGRTSALAEARPNWVTLSRIALARQPVLEVALGPAPEVNLILVAAPAAFPDLLVV